MVLDGDKLYAARFGGKPAIRAWAPGRVNLIGEHTDYNQGYVLPLAVDRGVGLWGSPTWDRILSLHSADFNESAAYSLDSLAYDPQHRWANYILGVADQLQKRGLKLKGAKILVTGDIPQGAGLSSSAALETASAKFLLKNSGLELGDLELVKAAQAAENEFVGVACGIMDQYVSYLGPAGSALLIDCRDLSNHPAALPKGLRVVVCDTKVKRTLAGSAYNERRRECEEGVAALSKVMPGLKSLRDLSLEKFECCRNLLSRTVQKRVRHVVTENQRVLDMVGALGRGDLARIGALMAGSHESLRDDYQVSCRELDLMVEAAQASGLAVGSRMTGGGFGGCTVNLVKAANVRMFAEKVGKAYERAAGIQPGIYDFAPSPGAKYI